MSNNPAGENPNLSELLNIKIDWRRDDRAKLSMKIGCLIRYAKAIEKFISEQAQEIENDLQEPPTGRSDDEIIDLYDELDELKNAFPKILRYSLFVYSYSFFEKTLLRIADDYWHRRKLELKSTDLKGNGITQTQAYLKKVVGISFPYKESSWQNVLTLKDIRNQIVHHEGELPKDHNNSKTTPKPNNAFQISPKGQCDILGTQKCLTERH